MTAPTLVKRRLTVNFQRSVLGGVPQVMEVAIAPLTSPSAPNNDATLVGGPQHQDVLLGNEKNPAFFDLVPTDYSGLTDRLTYRIAWREKYMGRQYTQDFVMPDFDVDFDDLQDLGNIIGGETYLQWSDRMRPGGVAGLNQSGQVVDSSGNPVTGAEAASVVQGNLDAEVVARQQGDQFLRQYFLQFADQQISAVYQTTSENLAYQVTRLENADLVESSARESADTKLHNDITGLASSAATAFNDVNTDIDHIHETLTVKADLAVNGKLNPAQLPEEALTKVVNVANEAAMLALTPAQVQPGDFAKRPDGVFFLNASPANNVNNWVKFSVVSSVTKVNGQDGDVVLDAAAVGARPAGVDIPQADITGLTTALGSKTNTATTTALTTRVSNIENDATVVKTVGGYIPHALNDDGMAYVNASGQVTKKDGTVLSFGDTGGGGGGGTGGTVAISDVTGLQTVLDSKAGVSDPRFTDTRTPKAHAASHATGQPDAITPAMIGARSLSVALQTADVTGLDAILANNGLTSTSDLDGVIANLNTRVNNLLPVAITDVTGLNTALNGKADAAATSAALGSKADLSGGKVPLTQANDYPISKVTGLQAALDNKIALVGGTVPLNQLPDYPTSKVTGLDAALGNMVALGPGGKLLVSQLPPEALTTATTVANRGAMVALTGVQPGDVCVINSTADKGTYMLATTDPTNYANWTKFAVPDDAVQSVNGYRDIVVLTASDVGARSSTVPINQAEVTGLTTVLGNKADQAAMTTALAGKTSITDVEAKITQSSQNKPLAALVATSSIPSLSGQQSIDGVLAPLGSIVLVTAQPSSVNNGMYQVASGAWPRIAEMANNDYFVRGTMVAVSGGGTNHDTIWQQNSASGYVGTNANNWVKTVTAGAPPTLTASLGVKKVVNDFQAQVVSGGGLQVVAGGLQIDPTVGARKFAGDVPAGSAIVTITHNLGTTDVGAWFRDKAAGDAILVGWKPTGVNAISVEFDSVPAAGQWRAVVVG